MSKLEEITNQDSSKKVTDIFLQYRSILGRLVGRIVKPDDIEDIVQETFIRTYDTAKDRPIDHPKTYMYTTARNLALNHISKKSSQVEDSVGDFDSLDVFANTETLDEQMETKEKFLLFCRAVRDLPTQCRRAFILKRIYGLSQKEIAEYLNISERTVEGHVAKGIVRCTRYLKSKGYLVRTSKAENVGRQKSKDVK